MSVKDWHPWDRFMKWAGYATWDEVVEAGLGNPTEEESEKICLLGYYGMPVTPQTIEGLKEGKTFQPTTPFWAMVTHPEEPERQRKYFDNKNELIAYARSMGKGEKESATSWITDFGSRVEVEGTTYEEVFHGGPSLGSTKDWWPISPDVDGKILEIVERLVQHEANLDAALTWTVVDDQIVSDIERLGYEDPNIQALFGNVAARNRKFINIDIFEQGLRGYERLDDYPIQGTETLQRHRILDRAASVIPKIMGDPAEFLYPKIDKAVDYLFRGSTLLEVPTLGHVEVFGKPIK